MCNCASSVRAWEREVLDIQWLLLKVKVTINRDVKKDLKPSSVELIDQRTDLWSSTCSRSLTKSPKVTGARSSTPMWDASS